MNYSKVAGLAALFALAASSVAAAQDFPSRPITIVNPYSAGGPADLISRTVGEGMTEVLGQPVVVENRTGAATAIAATYVSQADADGYTLLIAGSPTHIVTPALQEVNYKGIEDFAPVSMVALVPNVLVTKAGAGLDTVEDLVAKAKEGPDTISFASVGNGSLPHLSSVLFQQQSEIQTLHIPYGGAAPAVVDLLAGNVDMGFLNAPPLMDYIKGGELKALGVAATERSEQLPDVPTMDELGFEKFQMSTWYGISAPAGTPEDVVAKLNDAISKALEMPSVRDRLTKQGVQIFYKPSAEFASYLAEDSERMIGLIEAAGVAPK